MWVWALFIALLIAVVVIVVLQFTGIFDFSFITVAFQGLFQWAGTDIINSVLLFSSTLFFGAVLAWFYIRYVKGTAVNQTAPVYQPQGQTISAPTAKAGDTIITQ